MLSGHAQSNAVWYFGQNAGIDFTSGAPVAITSPLVAAEGSACISDAAGNIMFYTNGQTLWGRDHTPMPNGSGLHGGPSSAQPALIVPEPGNCGVFYVFTTEDHLSSGAFEYSVVDMCLNNGMGDVVTGRKNIQIASNMGEMLTAVPHANGVDIWIISHRRSSQAFRADLLTATGLSPFPIFSNTGAGHGSTCAIGMMKASHDGTRLAISSSFCNIMDLVNFDAATGSCGPSTNLMSSLGLPGGMYGLEFAPNDQRLYLASFWGTSRLFQVDLTTLSLIQLASYPGNYVLGGVQLGPDGRIYCTREGQPFLDVIVQPDVAGPGCGYSPGAFPLLGGTAGDNGLPNMIPATIMIPMSVTTLDVDLGLDVSTCDLPVDVHAQVECVVSAVWQDGVSGLSRTVEEPGTYVLTVSSACGVGSDSVVIGELVEPGFDLGTDTILCPGEQFMLALSTSEEVLWSDGSTGLSFLVDGPGVIWARIGEGPCSSADTLVVTRPAIDLGPDTLVCEGSTVSLTTTTGQAVIWQNGWTGATFEVDAPGAYSVQWQVGSCTVFDTVLVVWSPLPVLHLMEDTLLCDPGSVWLQGTAENGTLVWPDGSLTSTYLAREAGSYVVQAVNECGRVEGSVSVSYAPVLEYSGLVPVCPGAQARVELPWPVLEATWSNGDIGPAATMGPGTYGYTAIDVLGCVRSGELEVIEDQASGSGVQVPNVFTPNGDGVNELFLVKGAGLEDFQLKVLDRWGLVLYESNSPVQGWNGKADGAEVPAGVYFYTLRGKASCTSEERKERAGHLMLLR